MRTFEITIIVILFISILLRAFRLEKANWLNMLPLLNLLAITYNFMIEGWRWQMIPLYLMALTFAGLSIRRIQNPQEYSRLRQTVISLLLLLIFSSLPWALPVPSFPTPPGPYPVGTQSFYWVDETRMEVYSPEADQVYAATPSKPTRVMVQVWYPAVPDSGDGLAPYLPDGLLDAHALSTTFGFPDFFLDHFSLAKTNALLNGRLATCFEQWPVLVFSHGWQGMRYQNTAQMEALASQGFIVFAPEHAYGAVISVYPDGTYTLNKPGALPKDVSDAEYQQAALILGDSWVGDLRFTLDQMQLLQDGSIPSIFSGHLDLAKLGMFGHSTGGGATMQTCAIDARCKAAFGMDPWLVPYNRTLPTQAVPQPAMLMFSEGWESKANLPLVESFWQASPTGTLRATLLGALHNDFTDMPLFSPVASFFGLKGSIKVERAIPLLNDFLYAFFQTHLLDPASSLLPQAESSYPEVQVITR